ncbi:polysaccharide deacetylase family protein [Paenibacillus sp. PL91]|uniref:polysaccharide deacetylase family protein n=1 Tax=Paenibacillus sp. PL91 TaxID=2729538 RepID=UPI00145E3072|nr:polysaccharide deacetylase family protein [Paenibacillus sp. PL91]MBC9200325.1 polysaccharide deacetylase family protein [Paenibacillus sp. PL91]
MRNVVCKMGMTTIGAALIGCLLLNMTSDSSVASANGKQLITAYHPTKNDKKRRAADMSWVRLNKQFPSAFLTNGPRHTKRVALTFDDAPDPRYTPAILDVLAHYDVCATFFVVGNRASKNPSIVKRIHNEGHIIGNHSYNHAVLSTLSLNNYQKQIWSTDAIIKSIVGYSPHFIRPPYGELLPQQVRWSKQAGFTIVNWDVDSIDWKNNPSSTAIMQNIKKTLQPGSIVLQHAGGGSNQNLSGTIHALPKLIQLLQSKGYELVTLPELVGQAAAR